jgi:hypothetical protein
VSFACGVSFGRRVSAGRSAGDMRDFPLRKARNHSRARFIAAFEYRIMSPVAFHPWAGVGIVVVLRAPEHRQSARRAWSRSDHARTEHQGRHPDGSGQSRESARNPCVRREERKQADRKDRNPRRIHMESSPRQGNHATRPHGYPSCDWPHRRLGLAIERGRQ